MSKSMFEDLVGVLGYDTPPGDAEVIPLFPPGVHDIVTNDLGDNRTEFTCASCDFTGVIARTDDFGAMRMARRLALKHAVQHRRKPCHDACVDEPGCLYDGEDG